ncbi:MAG: septal ring lytic transglycosylase RlpA family protein [Pseudolabrys sp.]|nr:septal ring lytic transglycosylase RlpA family protein [Pseudolabrys sp.]
MRTTMLAGVLFALLCGIANAPAFGQGQKDFSGLASFYDKGYVGKTANGERYDGTKFTAAHRTLPFGTRLHVTDKKTRRSVTVIVNDRGPFIKGRVLDLSYAAAEALRMQRRGVIQVTASVD